LPPDLVQEINNDFILDDPHTIEVLSNSIRELFLALPPLLFMSSHGGRHPPDWGGREDKLVVLFVECSGRIQTIVMSVSVEDGGFETRPLDLKSAFSEVLLTVWKGDLRQDLDHCLGVLTLLQLYCSVLLLQRHAESFRGLSWPLRGDLCR
jgi:hypothetical protein